MGAIVFGEDDYNLDTYAEVGLTKDDIIWIDLARNQNYWTVNMNNLRLGDEELDLEGTDLIFDTGMSFGIIPINDYNTILQHLKVNYDCNWYTQNSYHLTKLSDV